MGTQHRGNLRSPSSQVSQGHSTQQWSEKGQCPTDLDSSCLCQQKLSTA